MGGGKIMKHYIITAAVTLVSLSSSAYARDYNPDYNKGVSVSEFMTAATGNDSIQTNLPLPEISTAVIEVVNLKQELPASLAKESLKPLKGYVVPPISPRLLTSQVYKSGQEYLQLLQSHDDPTAYKLLGNWQSIVTVRAALVDDASALDSKSSDLYTQAMQINDAAHALQQKIDDFNADVTQYNNQCVNQHISDDCPAWSNRIDAARKELLSESAAQKAKVQKWNNDVSELKSSDNTWAIKVFNWETDIGYFISAVKSYLAGQVMCFKTGTETTPVPVEGNPPYILFLTKCIYTCVDNDLWSFAWTSLNGYLTCPGSVYKGEFPAMPIRRASPDFRSEKPGFISGNAK